MKNYITSKIVPLIKKERYNFIVFTIWFTFMAFMVTHGAEMALYRAGREVFVDRTYNGLYLWEYDLYVCFDQFSCEHERGHAYDASGASKTWQLSEWHSTNENFRANIDAMNTCTATIFANYDIWHTEYPKTSQSLMTTKYYIEYYDGDKDEIYREIYAELYAIMKTYRWDQYHYDDVEDMIAQKAIACQRFLDENAETLRPRQN